MPHACSWVLTPAGRLRLCTDGTALTAVLWERERPGRVAVPAAPLRAEHPLLCETAQQLTEYFAGTRTAFTLPLAPRGTPFQQRVWQQLRDIPFGETRSYAEIARILGDPNLTRAVGAANGRNPLSIVIPCHRVVGSAGSLVGFAGGVAAKAYLLALEKGQHALFDLAVPAAAGNATG